MRGYWIALLVISCLFLFSGNVSALERQIVCSSGGAPSGWLVDDYVNASGCGPSGGPGEASTNAFRVVRYNNLPVGQELTVCPQTIPAGWSLISSNEGVPPCWDAFNPTPYQYSWKVRHISCVNQDQATCYPQSPPAPTGQLSVSTTSVTIPYGQSNGSVNVSWTTQNTSSACVWISSSGNNPSPWACTGPSGSKTWPYVPVGSNTKFILTTNANGSTPSPILATKTVTGVAGAQPTLKLVPKYNLVQTGATSGDVLIPATASPSEGPFTFTWNAPGYSSVDLVAQINGGSWTAPLQIAASGTTTQPMPLGTTYNYRLVPHGAASPIFATMSVRGIAAPAPTFSINPAHVIVPAGATEGNFSFNWNAPGYEYLNLTGQINGGAWSAPFAIQASGSSSMSIPVGSTYKYRFYPPNDTTHIIGTLSVTASR